MLQLPLAASRPSTELRGFAVKRPGSWIGPRALYSIIGLSIGVIVGEWKRKCKLLQYNGVYIGVMGYTGVVIKSPAERTVENAMDLGA